MPALGQNMADGVTLSLGQLIEFEQLRETHRVEGGAAQLVPPPNVSSLRGGSCQDLTEQLILDIATVIWREQSDVQPDDLRRSPP
jgi:hypothetical protein